MRKTQSGPYIPARLQSALALLEKLRTQPNLDLESHLASKGSTGLESHETYGNQAHERLEIQAINKNHGRRSSSLQDWGQELLNLLGECGFGGATGAGRRKLIDLAQDQIAARLRAILNEDPIRVGPRGRAVEAVVADVLAQAEEKGKVGEVAQYLVGAKLALRLNLDMTVRAANKADRKSRVDTTARLGDFQVANTVIEVAVGMPDDAHLAKIVEALEDHDCEVWLLTRAERVGAWKTELGLCELSSRDLSRVVVASVESFVGQNVSEMGEFSTQGKFEQFENLIAIYNERWVATVGTPGIRIVVKSGSK